MPTRFKESLQVFGCLGVPLAFLLVVFYPVFGELQENARSATCQSNLKKLGLALGQ